MRFDDYSDEAEVLALVDDWLSTTPEIFGDDYDEATESFLSDDDDFWYDDTPD